MADYTELVYLVEICESSLDNYVQLLGAVVGVEDNWDAVCGRDGADIVGTSDGSLDGSALVLVVDTLSGEVCGTTLGHLEDDGGLGIAGSLKGCDNG